MLVTIGNAARRIAASVALALALALGPAAATSAAADTFVMTDGDGVAIGGYDAVAYFADGAATMGTAAHSLRWQGAEWRFASAEHRAAFESNPAKYAPQYGGWCAYGAAEGYAAESDPRTAWTVRGGKLYLNWDAGVRDRWLADVQSRLARAEANWPDIRDGLSSGSGVTVYRK